MKNLSMATTHVERPIKWVLVCILWRCVVLVSVFLQFIVHGSHCADITLDFT